MGGSALFARYDFLCELTAGGMATVHLGRRIGAAGFDRLVVIKRVHRHLVEADGVRSMFVDEARISSNVHHPNVVPVVDVFDEDGELALVMDYVESVSLSALLSAARAKNETLPLEIVSRILGDALIGLHAAHEAVSPDGASLDIVHRDVSPQNIIVGTDGVARLIDFGIATAQERISVTKDNVLKGKLRYMSPEQARREPLDRRSDIFSAGLVLYEALAGRPAFSGNDEATIWIALVLGEVEAITGLPTNLKYALGRALERKPEDRFPSALLFEEMLRAAVPPASPAAVAACVERYLGPRIATVRESIRTARRGTPPSQQSFEPPSTALAASRSIDATTVDPIPPGARHRWIAAAVALVGLTLLLGASFRTREAPPEKSVAVEPPPTVVPVPVSSPKPEASEGERGPPRASASTAPAETGKRVVPHPPPVRSAPGRKLHDNPYGR